MNDVNQNLLNQLERATARGRSSGNNLDEETAALREGWLAFSQLMQSADAKNQALPMAEFSVPVDRRRQLLFYGAAVAASLLLVVGVMAWTWSDLRAPATLPAPSGIAKSNPRTSLTPAQVDSPNSANSPLNTTRDSNTSTIPTTNSPHIPIVDESQDPIAWNDHWDDRLDAAQVELARVQGSWNSVDVSLRSLSWQLDQVGDSLADESL